MNANVLNKRQGGFVRGFVKKRNASLSTVNALPERD
jgi:hypothetical protein